MLPDGYPTDLGAAYGLLQSRPKLSVDDLKVLALIECAGETFYTLIANSVDNAEAAALLKRNGQEERGHAHRLKKAIQLLTGADYVLPEGKENPFARDLPASIMVDEKFLAGLEGSERDGDAQYRKWADAESNGEVARLFRQNGAEEMRHGERAAAVRSLLAAAT
jgi:rubrerythrin